MHKEHEQLAGLLQQPQTVSDGVASFVTGQLGNCRLVLMQSGIGKVNAAVGGVELIRRFAPDAIVNTGVAGGIIYHITSKVKLMFHSIVQTEMRC